MNDEVTILLETDDPDTPTRLIKWKYDKYTLWKERGWIDRASPKEVFKELFMDLCEDYGGSFVDCTENMYD